MNPLFLSNQIINLDHVSRIERDECDDERLATAKIIFKDDDDFVFTDESYDEVEALLKEKDLS